MGTTRTKKSIMNIITGVGYQTFTIFISFISRTVFIHTLGSGYLGISSLFTNILSVLSLAELGVGTAMTYSMYEPLATNNHNRLASLVQYFKKIYHLIAIVVFICGIVIIPFLRYFIKLSEDIPYLNFYFFLYLIDTVVSYLCVYKTILLTADQKDYVIKFFRISFDITRLIIQLFVLIVLKNFTIYLIIQIACSIINNVVMTIYVNKKYLYINHASSDIMNEEKGRIWKNVRAMFSYKIGGVILNNTDQLLISIIVCTEAVGLYSNYYMPIKLIMGVTSAVFIAIQASIGNLAIEKNSKRQFEIFKILDLLSFLLYGFFTICFCVLLQDFILLWIGNSYLLSNNIVYIISCTYYFTGVLYPIWCFRETVGLFQHTKNIMIYASIINIIFSLLLGKHFGLEGILGATIIARVLTNMWFEPYKLFEIYFDENIRKYYLGQIIKIVYVFFSIVILKFITGFIQLENTLLQFLIKGMLCTLLSFVLLIIVVWRTKEFKYIAEIGLKIVKKKQVMHTK